MNEGELMRGIAASLAGIFLFAAAPAALAVPIVMTPDPVGDWICDAGRCGASSIQRTLQITLVSGDTQPMPTIVLRLDLSDGGPAANSTVSFDFDFDTSVDAVSVVGSTGNFGVAPTSQLGGGDPRIDYNCTDGPCTVNVEFQFLAMPAFGDFTDRVNQFVDSPDGPAQTLRGNFPEPGLVLLLAAAGLAFARRRRL